MRIRDLLIDAAGLIAIAGTMYLAGLIAYALH